MASGEVGVALPGGWVGESGSDGGCADAPALRSSSITNAAVRWAEWWLTAHTLFLAFRSWTRVSGSTVDGSCPSIAEPPRRVPPARLAVRGGSPVLHRDERCARRT